MANPPFQTGIRHEELEPTVAVAVAARADNDVKRFRISNANAFEESSTLLLHSATVAAAAVGCCCSLTAAANRRRTPAFVIHPLSWITLVIHDCRAKRVVLVLRSQPDNRRSRFSRRCCKLLSYSDPLRVYISGHGYRETIGQHRTYWARTAGVSAVPAWFDARTVPRRATRCSCSAAKRLRATATAASLLSASSSALRHRAPGRPARPPGPTRTGPSGHWRTSRQRGLVAKQRRLHRSRISNRGAPRSAAPLTVPVECRDYRSVAPHIGRRHGASAPCRPCCRPASRQRRAGGDLSPPRP